MNVLGRRVKSMNYAWVWVACGNVRNRCIKWLNESWICVGIQSASAPVYYDLDT